MNNHISSNSSKSINGNKFNETIIGVLSDSEFSMQFSIKKEPSYAYPGFAIPQFRPDFEIVHNQFILLIDNTTTIRNDRLKQKQWDANGAKQSLALTSSKPIYYIVVTPSLDQIGSPATRQKEAMAVLSQKKKIHNNTTYSAIDDIIPQDELHSYIRSLVIRT